MIIKKERRLIDTITVAGPKFWASNWPNNLHIGPKNSEKEKKMKKLFAVLTILIFLAIPMISFSACNAVIVESSANGTTVKVPMSIVDEFGGDAVKIFAEDVTYNGEMKAKISDDGRYYVVSNSKIDLTATNPNRSKLHIAVKLATNRWWPEVDQQQGDDASIPAECVVPGSDKGWDYLASVN